MELEDVADELYEVPPEEFIAVRTERQNEAKSDGDPALAKAIGALPKPSLAAWVCNVLVRAHREEIEGLVELGDLLRSAQENLAGDQLRALNTQRGQLLNALTRRASAVARERGHPVSTSVQGQVEETLRAAMADPEAGEALLTGRITSSMSYNGMGTTVSRPDLRLVRPPAPERAPSPQRSAPAKSAPRPSADERRREREREQAEARRAAEEKRKRELAEAQKAADEATAAAEEARVAAEDERQRYDDLDARRQSIEARVAELADQLARAEGEVAVVARERALARVEQLSADES